MFNEREMKFLRLALDPGAHEGEIDNAAIALIGSLRVRLAKAADFETKPHVSSQTSEVDWGAVKFNFGKMKGQPIRDASPDYLMWCMEWIRNGDEDLQKRFGNVLKAIEKYLGE